MIQTFTSFVLILFSITAQAENSSEASKLESKHQIRVGVFATQGDITFSYRADERFAYCSTFKWILCSAILKKVEAHELSLEKEIHYQAQDLLNHSPVTSQHVKEGKMKVGELCAATIQESDNAAANLLSPLVGNTGGLQKFVRGLGDSVTRFDRPEPHLNTNLDQDPRDTTSPQAMTSLLKEVFTGPKFNKVSQDQLLSWMKATTTGANRIRAGVPMGWAVADKTGTGDHGAANDVAVIFPPKAAPIYISIFTTGEKVNLKAHEEAISEMTKLALKSLTN